MSTQKEDSNGDNVGDSTQTAIVKAFYLELLGRQGDPGGLETYIRMLDDGISVENIRKLLRIFIDGREGAPKLFERTRAILEDHY